MEGDPEITSEETSLLKPSIEASEPDHADDEREATVLKDVVDTLVLGTPIFMAMLSWVGMKTTDTALLGHVSADALAAAALSDLWTMCTAVLVQGRILSVLCGSAVGAGNPKLAGIYLQVSYAVLLGLGVVVFASWYMTGYVWQAFGNNAMIADMAGYYARALAWSIPGQLAFSQLSQFFQAQRIMQPEVVASFVALALNLLLGLIFVLGIPFPNFDGYGFSACPAVTTMVVYIQFTFFYIVYIKGQKLHEACWGGWDMKEITWDRIKTFSDLYFPAAFGMASDFWRVAVVGAIAANLGELEVAVFNTSYRIMWIVLIMVNALSSAAGIKMSQRLGDMNPSGAKQAGEVGILLSFLVLAAVISFVFFFIRAFGMIFTYDEDFLSLFETSRVPFCCTLFLMNMSVAIERIPYSMGRTKEVFWTGFFASWGAQVPGVYFLTTYWRNDLFGLYCGMAIGYLVLMLLYGYITITSDWKRYAEIARERSEMSGDPVAS